MINYFGTKKAYDLFGALEISKIIQNSRFIDLFGGGGSVTLNKEPSSVEFWNEVYKPSFLFYYWIQKDFQKLYKKCWSLTPLISSHILYGKRDFSSLDVAAAFFVYSETCFNGNAGTNWDVGISKGKRVDLSKLRVIQKRFKNVELFSLDFRSLLSLYRDEDFVIYADPPYWQQSRGSKDNRNKIPELTLSRRRYQHEFIEQDHIDLAVHLRNRKAIVSGYDSDFYDQLYLKYGFRKIQLTEKEFIWMNL